MLLHRIDLQVGRFEIGAIRISIRLLIPWGGILTFEILGEGFLPGRWQGPSRIHNCSDSLQNSKYKKNYKIWNIKWRNPWRKIRWQVDPSKYTSTSYKTNKKTPNSIHWDFVWLHFAGNIRQIQYWASLSRRVIFENSKSK